MKHVAFLCIACLLLALAPVPSRAAPDPSQFVELYGNWEMVWERPKNTLAGTGSFTDKGPGPIVWGKDGLDYFQTLRVEGGKVRGASVDGRFELTLSGDGTVATGQWGGHPTAWRRVMEKVERIEVLPGRGGTLDYAKLLELWRDVTSAGNLPTVRLVVTGSGLPKHPSDAGMIDFDLPGFYIPTLRRFPDSGGTKIEVEVALTDPKPGPQTLRINGRPFPFALELTNAPVACTALKINFPTKTLLVEQTENLKSDFTPQGCRPYARGKAFNDDKIVYFLSNGQAASFYDGKTERPVPADSPVSAVVTAHAAGTSDLRATFGSLADMITIQVRDREPCGEMQITASSRTVVVGGRIKIGAPELGSTGNADFNLKGGDLLPRGCSFGAKLEGQLAVDRPDRARVEYGTLVGLAPGRVVVGYTLGQLGARVDVEVVPQPPCDRIGLYYGTREIRVGGVAGPASARGLHLSYERSDAPKEWQGECVKPSGIARFEALTREATVDAVTGVVTGVRPGNAGIAVVHGDLFAIAEIRVVEGKVCTELELRFRKYLSPGDVSEPLPLYVPVGCVPPPGQATFIAMPPPLASLSPDGVLTAMAPGTSTVTMRHGNLSASYEAKIGDFENCKAMTARFDPPQVVDDQFTRLVLDYQPDPCIRPDGEPVVDRPAVLIPDPGGDPLLYYSAPSIYTAGSGPFPATVTHGELKAEARVLLDRADCMLAEVKVVPSTIRPGQTARAESRTSPPNCVVWAKAHDPQVKVDRRGSEFLIEGIEGGKARVDFFVSGRRALSVKTVTIAVEAPPCNDLDVEYYPNPLNHVTTITRPELDYWPLGCTRPAGRPNFTSSAPDLLRHQDSHVVGLLALRPARIKESTKVTITVTHGPLLSSAVIGVDDEW